MNLIEITEHIIHQLRTDDQFFPIYTRYSADHYTVQMGESDEPVYNEQKIAELEAAFQKWVTINK